MNENESDVLCALVERGCSFNYEAGDEDGTGMSLKVFVEGKKVEASPGSDRSCCGDWIGAVFAMVGLIICGMMIQSMLSFAFDFNPLSVPAISESGSLDGD